MDDRDEQKFSSEIEQCYEAIASQEEVYLEETEEELRMVLIAEDSNQSRASSSISINLYGEERINCMLMETKDNDRSLVVEVLNEQLNHSVEELIAGDSDDAPLSDELLEQMLRHE
jgi:hypothetical protein